MRIVLGLSALLLFLSACGGSTCATDADCGLPAVCGDERRCVVPEARADGEPCSDDRHCAGGACVISAGAGTCATTCADATECPSARCGPTTDDVQLRFTCGAVSGDRFYAERCTSDGDCRTGLCHDGRCVTPCGTCPSGFECQPATVTRMGHSLDHGVCTWWPVQPVVELGPAVTTASAPASLSFDLPAGADAFTLVLEEADGQVPEVTKLVAPDGRVFIGNTSDAGVDLARCASGSGGATVLVPGSDLEIARPTPGRWTMDVTTYDATGFPLTLTPVAGHVDRVAAVLKRAERGGLVDVTIQMAPEVGYSVADGGGTWVQALLARFEELTRAKAGVSVGQVRLASLPPDAGVTVSTLADSRALWAKFSQGAVASRPINVMVVKELSFAGGVSGGTPGAPGVYGRPGSGITIAPLASGPQATGTLMAHEVLHWLGLFHTSDEFFGGDLVSDTPECADPTGSNCPDVRNLMFPYFPTRDPLTLTAGQAKVLEGSPWVYRWRHPFACGVDDVIGLGGGGWAAGTTAGAPATHTASCGGAGGERVHLVRLEAAATKLEATATGSGFSPVLSVRRGDCDGMELACAEADGGVATISIDAPAAGAYFVWVDSTADGGAYELDVQVTP